MLLLLLIIQIITIFGLLEYFFNNHFNHLSWLNYEVVEIVYIIFNIVAVVFTFKTISKDEASEYKIIWIICIGFLHIYGVIFYFMFRNSRSAGTVVSKIDRESKIAEVYHQQDVELLGKIKEENLRFYGLSRLVGELDYVTYTNTSVRYFAIGQDMFECMLQDLKSAKKYIFLEYFIIHEGYMWDCIVEILKEKAKEGVEVLLMTDGFGSANHFKYEYRNYLKKHGIQVQLFSPLIPIISMLKNNRDHRKILVVDGLVAYNGGINIGDEYINKINRFGVWKDTGLRLEGAAVFGFSLMFLQMWQAFCSKNKKLDYDDYKTTSLEQDLQNQLCKLNEDKLSTVVPFGVNPFGKERLGENVYMEILNKATDYCYITTPYLLLSEKMIHALRLAVKRGVDVRIIVPGIPDKKLVYKITRSYYRYLLKYGVRLYEYTPGFLHAKIIVSDDEVAVVGTINLDYRSLYLHFECGTLLCNDGAIADIKSDVLDTLSQSKEVITTKNSVFNFGFWDSILHLFAPLL